MTEMTALKETIVRARCAELGLSYDKVATELERTGGNGTVVRVALFGEDTGWPTDHVNAARSEFR
jgi:uncharacterized membrane protein (DUF441 family)